MEDSNYNHTKRICKGFEIKDLGEYHDLFLKVIHYYLMFLKTFEKCVAKFLN